MTFQPPSRGNLARGTLIALVAAAAVSVLVVLPAERGIDLTGFGRLTGLTARTPAAAASSGT